MSVIYDLSNEYGGRIIGDGAEDTNGLLQLTSASSLIPALRLSRATGSASGLTVGLIRFEGTSTASAAVMSFVGGFISTTSVLGIAATGAGLGVDYVLPVSLNGVMRGIPLFSLVSLPGAAAF
jgi:hypothetical protein